jgi:hypothetical protein
MSAQKSVYDPETKAVIEAVSDLFPGSFVLFRRPKKLDMAIQVTTPELLEAGAVSWSVYPKKGSTDRDISDLRHYIEQVCQEHNILDSEGEPDVCWPRHRAMTSSEQGVLIPRISGFSEWHPKKHNGTISKNVKWTNNDCYLSWVSNRVAQQKGGQAAQVQVF